jgi:hypothetical protein
VEIKLIEIFQFVDNEIECHLAALVGNFNLSYVLLRHDSFTSVMYGMVFCNKHRSLQVIECKYGNTGINCGKLVANHECGMHDVRLLP